MLTVKCARGHYILRGLQSGKKKKNLSKWFIYSCFIYEFHPRVVGEHITIQLFVKKRKHN